MSRGPPQGGLVSALDRERELPRMALFDRVTSDVLCVIPARFDCLTANGFRGGWPAGGGRNPRGDENGPASTLRYWHYAAQSNSRHRGASETRRPSRKR